MNTTAFPTVLGQLPVHRAQLGFNFTTADCHPWPGYGLGMSLAPKATLHTKTIFRSIKLKEEFTKRVA